MLLSITYCQTPSLGSFDSDFPLFGVEDVSRREAGTTVMTTQVQTNVEFRIFRASNEASWDTLLAEAAAFASTLENRQIVNISHSSDRGNGTVVVWYVKELQ